MDWLTLKFCALIWILCVSKSQSQLRNSTNTSNQLRSACLEGQPVVPPDPCNTCICFSGQVHCTNLSCQEKECIKGMELPQPDECNKCICRRGKVKCTDMICIPAPQCTENQQMYLAQNKCNACICKDGFISCTSNVCVEEPNTTITTTTKPKKKEKCEEGSRLPGPHQCLDCICQNGKKRCKNICNPVVESQFEGPECYAGQHLPMPDECNSCICFEGQIHCTQIPCRMDTRTSIGPQCTDDHQVYRPDECNECYCIEGRLECSDLVCIRGSKCVAGQVIPKPDSCNTCKCVNGYILCTHHQCALVSRNALLPGPSAIRVMPQEDCQEGDYIPPPPPPNDCNTCYCMDNHIVCTMNSCEDPISGFKGRLKKKNEITSLEFFDKKIPVEPFIDILYTKNDKTPHKLTHSHTYNGFHQEIKVHASHLPKDTTKLLNVLANSLDNAALASISKKLLTSNSVSRNQDSKKPFDHSVNQTNQLGEGNLLSPHSSKLITSGSQSNETILVFPHTKPFDDKDSLSVLPLESKNEPTWKTVSAPDTLVHNNGIQILSRHSQEKNGHDYYDKPPAMITPIDSNPIIRNPAKLGSLGQHFGLLTKPVRYTVDTPSIPAQSIYPTLHPKPINLNDDKMIYAPSRLSTKPRPTKIINHTSSTLGLRPELNPDNNVGQQKLSQYQFPPNPSNFEPNQVSPEQVQSKPKRILSLSINYYNKNGVSVSPQYLNNPNPQIVSANQFGLKPSSGISYPDNIHLNPAPTNLPYQKTRIPTINNEAPQFEPNSKAHHSDILNSSQNVVKPKHKQPNSPQFKLIPNPSIYYKYEAPKIIEENPDQDKLTPNSIISYKHSEDYDPLHTPSESGFKKLPHKVHNKITKRDNSTHSHYEKHNSVTYVAEYDPNDPYEDSHQFDLTKKVDHYLNIPYLQLDQSESKSIQSYLSLPGQRQNDTLHPTMTEINKYNQQGSWNITNKQFEEDSLSPSKSKQTDIKTKLKETYSVSPNIFAVSMHNSSKIPLVSPQENSEKEGPENTTHPKSNFLLESKHETTWKTVSAPDTLVYNNGIQILSRHSQEENGKDYYNKLLAMITPIDSNPIIRNPAQLGPDPDQNYGLPTKPASDTEDTPSIPTQSIYPTLHPKPININDVKMIYAPFSSENKQINPAPSSFVANHDEPHFHPFQSTKPRPYHIINHTLPTPVLTPEHNPQNNVGQHKPSQYQFAPNPSNFYPNQGAPERFQSKPKRISSLPINYYNNKVVPVPPVLMSNDRMPGMFDEHRPGDSVQNPFNLTEDLTHPKVKLNKSSYFDPYKSMLNAEQLKDNQHILLYSQFGPTQNQHKPEDNHGVVDGFQYAHNANEGHRELKPFYKLPPDLAPNKQTQGMLDERVSPDEFRYPSYLTENLLHSRGNLHNLPPNQFGHDEKRLPDVFDDHGSADGFYYPSKSADISLLTKDKLNELFIKNEPTENPNEPWIIEDRGSASGLQNPPSSTENSSFPKGNIPNLPHPKLEPNQNQRLPGVFDGRGSTDGLHYPTKSDKLPFQPKYNNLYKPQNPPFRPTQKQHLPGVFDDHGSANGLHYSSNSAKTLFNPKHYLYKPSNSLLLPTQKLNQPGVFDDQGFADGIQYPFISAEGPKHSKENIQKSLNFQFSPILDKPTQDTFGGHGSMGGIQYPFNSAEHPKHSKVKTPHSPLGPIKHLPGIFDERGSADGFQYPSHSAEDLKHPNNNPDTIPESNFKQSQQKKLIPSLLDPSHSQSGPNQNQHLPEVFEDRGSADEFHYPSDSAEDLKHPNNNPDTTPESNFKQSQKKLKPSLLDQISQYISENYNDETENPPKSNNYNSNPVRPWMYLDHDHYKHSTFDNLPNGVHNIPWSLPEDDDKALNTVSSTRPPRYEPDYDQSKPSFFDNLLIVDNGIQHMSKPIPSQDNNALGSNDELITPQSVFKPGQDQNETLDIFDEDGDHLQIEIDNSTDLINSDIMQNNFDIIPDSLLPTDGGKFPDYYDKLFSLFIALKKLSDLSNNNSDLSIMDELELLFVSVMSGIADILNYNLSKEQEDDAPVEKQVIQRIFPLKKLKSKLNQLTDNDNRILNWLKSKLIKFISTIDNTTETKNEIDLTKIFIWLSKLTSNRIKTSTENIPFNGFDPEIVEKIMNDFKEDTQTVTPTPSIVKTTNDNRFHSVSTTIDNTQQQDTKKYPEVHIILNQPDVGDEVDLPPYIEADGEAGPALDMRSEEVHSTLFPTIFHPRFRHRPQHQKDECEDGTQCISNCHTCSCYFGQTMCLRMQDCKLRPFGEPMICKPYSHFKMGCYTCECNGDGVVECHATDCGKEPKGKRQGSHELVLPIYHSQFFDNKKTDEILQYYKFYKKLPKDCLRPNAETEYPTCERGTSWISSCHKCECNERGKHECTKINDCVLDFYSYGKPGRCKPNSKFYPRTNSMPCVECLCNDEGIPYCPEADLKKH